MKIKLFGSFITEKLGVLSNLEKIADVVIHELSTKNYFRYKTTLLGKEVTINFFKQKTSYLNKKLLGSFSVDNDYEFTIKVDSLSKSTIIHELKHLDRIVRRTMKTDTYYYINHIGRYISKEYGYLFNDKESIKVLGEIFYLCNPDEFESYYNSFYFELNEIINDKMSREEKFKIIKEYLESQQIFLFFKYYYYNSFNLVEFFKSTEDCNFFLNEFFLRQERFYSSDYDITILDKIKNWFNKKILNSFKDEKINNDFKQFNFYINKIIKNNYKKFYRLYSLF